MDLLGSAGMNWESRAEHSTAEYSKSTARVQQDKSMGEEQRARSRIWNK